MKSLTLQQGSDAWLAHRRTTRNASEAPAMMGCSPYVTRGELIRQRATGLETEVDEATQRRFDRGHAVEPALRALAEKIIGEDLYPVTGVSDDGRLGASFDGVTLGEDTIFEAKQHSAEKRACIYRGEIPPADKWQIVHQFAVCTTATSCLYLCGDGTEENTAQLWIERSQVEGDIAKLLAGWAQFDADVAAYVPEPATAPAPAGRAPDQLPALSIQVTGMVTASNLAEFKANALAVLGTINRDLQTDEDFANAEKTVKWCSGVEERLKATKDQILGQTADIEAVFRTMDEVSAETRRIRLELDKLVTREKENRKLEIVTKARRTFDDHVTALKAETKGVWILALAPDFAGAIKGKKSLTSMKDAVDTVLANAKIAANESAAHVRAALACLAEEMGEHRALFADWLSLVPKPIEDIRSLVRGRIAEHQTREQEKADALREQIRQEEADKLAAQQADEQRQRDEDARKAAEPAPESVAATPEQEAPRKFGVRLSPLDGEPGPALAAVPTAAAVPAPPIKLGQINEWLAPLSIDAAGLAQLGFQPVGSKGAAKLYAAGDFPRICVAISTLVASALTNASARSAA